MLGLVAFAAAAAGDTISFYTGNTLYAECSASEKDPTYFQKASNCGGFIIGVYDTQAVLLSQRPLVCITLAANRGQLVDVAKQWLERNPAQRHRGAAGLVVQAFIEAFPCPKE